MGPGNTITKGNKTGIVRGPERLVEAALFEGAGCEPFAGHGRGSVWRFPLPDGWGIVRPYRRGGMARYLLRDGYLLANRPLAEWRVHRFLFERGFPVPEPLGVAWERSGLVYRGALATREADAVDIMTFACARPGEVDLFARVGELIRAMHDLGVYHADLQVRNILVTRDGNEVLFIDFDNGRRYVRLSKTLRARNLLRLRRSCEKNGLPAEAFQAILAGYEWQSFPRWLDCLYRWKGTVSDLAAGRERAHVG